MSPKSGVECESALILRGTVVTTPGRREAVSLILDDGADCNLVSQSTVKRLGLIPLKGAALPKAESFQGGKAYVYGAHTLRLRLEDSQGATRETEGRFYAVTLPSIDLILGRPWRKAHGVVADSRTNRWRYGIDAELIELCSVNAMRAMEAQSEFTTAVRACLVSAATVGREIGQSNETLYPLPPGMEDLADVFDTDPQRMRQRMANTSHAIRLKPDTVPPFQPLHNLSRTELEELRDYLAKATANGWIRRSVSEAGAPILFAPKKDGSLRLCVDYRGLNAVTMKDRTPLPLISETLDRLSGAKVFSALDLKDAYYRVPIRRGDEWKTAFRTRYGHFEYLVMPFGLTNAPATFQAYINKALAGYLDDFCVVYLDDILIYSRTREEHTHHLRLVLERLRKYALFANPKKCHFFTDQVEFLGFIVSGTGVSMDPRRVSTVKEWPEPETYRAVQQFLGFANFYRRFIHSYSRIVRPLTDLLKGSVNGRKPGRLQMNEEEKAAFRRVCEAFTRAPILVHYDPEKPLRLETDASGFASAAILSQLCSIGDENPQWHPVAYWSKKFIPAEQRYETYDQELLAIVGAFKHWRHYLEGAAHPVRVLTDHNNLKGFMTLKQLNGRQARWATFLASFDFEIEHRAGKHNPADAPSRRPDYEPVKDPRTALLPTFQQKLQYWAEEQDQGPSTLLRRVVATTGPRRGGAEEPQMRSAFCEEARKTLPRKTVIALARAEDPYEAPTADIEDTLRLLTKPEWVDSMTKTQRGRRAGSAYVLRNGLLYKNNILCVPDDSALKAELLKKHHDDPLAGHFGVAKTIELLTRKYLWEGLRKDVQEYVKSCAICQRTKAKRHKPYGEMVALPLPQGPFQELAMDYIVDLPPSGRGDGVSDAILVVVDRYTKMSKYIPCNKTCTAEELCTLIFDHIVCKYGMPRGIVTDRGSVFTSEYWSSVCYAAKVKRRLSTAFHPQTDGQTERENQALEQYLRCFCTDHQDDWKQLLHVAEFATNNCVSATLGVSPFYALMGYNPSIHTISTRDEPPEGGVPAAEERVRRLEHERSAMEKTWKHAQEAQTRYYNKTHKPQTYKVGDMVLLSLKNIRLKLPTKKLSPRFAGPYRVIDLVGTQAYRLALPKDLSRIHNVFHVSLLEPWTQRGDSEEMPMPVAIDPEGEPEWEVEAILQERRRKGVKQYLVKWLGWPDTYNQWEPEKNLNGSQDLIREYKESKKKY